MTDTILEQLEQRFGQVEGAMHRLTWAVSLWGGVITMLLGIVLIAGRH